MVENTIFEFTTRKLGKLIVGGKFLPGARPFAKVNETKNE